MRTGAASEHEVSTCIRIVKACGFTGVNDLTTIHDCNSISKPAREIKILLNEEDRQPHRITQILDGSTDVLDN